MTFMKSAALVALCLLFGATSASAQGVYYPGSMWTSNGTLTPVERGNLTSLTHAEQGIAYRGAELFAQTTLSVDTDKYDWNRRALAGIGVRLTQTMKGGMVRVGVSYLSERRFVTPRTISGLAITADAWFGWNQSPRGGR